MSDLDDVLGNVLLAGVLHHVTDSYTIVSLSRSCKIVRRRVQEFCHLRNGTGAETGNVQSYCSKCIKCSEMLTGPSRCWPLEMLCQACVPANSGYNRITLVTAKTDYGLDESQVSRLLQAGRSITCTKLHGANGTTKLLLEKDVLDTLAVLEHNFELKLQQLESKQEDSWVSHDAPGISSVTCLGSENGDASAEGGDSEDTSSTRSAMDVVVNKVVWGSVHHAMAFRADIRLQAKHGQANVQVADRVAQAVHFVLKHAVNRFVRQALWERYGSWQIRSRHSTMVLSALQSLAAPGSPGSGLASVVSRMLPTTLASYERIKHQIVRDAVPLARRGSKYKPEVVGATAYKNFRAQARDFAQDLATKLSERLGAAILESLGRTVLSPRSPTALINAAAARANRTPEALKSARGARTPPASVRSYASPRNGTAASPGSGRQSSNGLPGSLALGRGGLVSPGASLLWSKMAALVGEEDGNNDTNLTAPAGGAVADSACSDADGVGRAAEGGWHQECAVEAVEDTTHGRHLSADMTACN